DGGDVVAAGTTLLQDAGIPTFPYPDTAAQMFNYLWRDGDKLRALYETPTLPDSERAWDRAQAAAILGVARRERRTLLDEFEAKQVLAAYGIPVVETRVARNAEAAVRAAAVIGFPVVLKLYSRTITHKTDVGGVQLNLPDAAAVHQAYQLIEESVRSRVG